MSPRQTVIRALAALLLASSLSACLGGQSRDPANPFAPTVDTHAEAVDGLTVGHRLMEAKEYQLALEAYTRAINEKGLTAEVLVALGSANLALGRLNQSEKLLRRAVKADPEWPEAWNNLGVLLMETGKTGEAAKVFEKAYALDNGENDSIRDNLRLALAKLENTSYGPEEEKDFRLIRYGNSSYEITANRG